MEVISLVDYLIGIADAIRYAESSTGKINAMQFDARIRQLSGGQPVPPEPSDYPEKIFRDITIIPDMYNTGHSGELTPWMEADAYLNTTLTWRDNITWLDFNNGKCFKNVADNTTFTFENIDFTANDNPRFRIENLSAYSESSTYFRRGIKFVFKNCKFGQLFMNYNSSVAKEDLSFEYDYCTFGNFGGIGLVTNCRIGGLNFEYANASYRNTVLGNDLVKPMNGTKLKDCYLYDLEYETETQEAGHLDGLQALHIDGFSMENVRVECFDFTFPSQGGWSYTLYLEYDASNILIKDCIFSGGGHYGVAIALDGDNKISENNKISLYNNSASFYNDTYSEGFSTTDNLYVTSIWHKEDEIQIVCTNETQSDRILRIVDNNGHESTFNIGKLPKRLSDEANAITSWNELPFNKVFTIPAENVEWFKCYDGETLIRTWRVTDENQKGPGVIPQPIPSEDVPQSGTWQMKTTPQGGFVIIGKDDDTTDQAMYVRMVSGYGFPVTINTTWDAAYNMASHKQIPDTDSQYSLYPENSVSRVPEYCSVHDLNRIIIDNNLGEVAQHGLSSKNIWDSRYVTDDQIDYMYTNYTSGGGTKSKDAFWELFKETFRDCDAAYGAEYAQNDRASLEADLGIPIRTLGCWGASGDREIEGIAVCPVGYLARGSYDYARSWNYWADGPVTSYNSANIRNPYRITRDSTGFNSVETVTRDLGYAYRDASCIEFFTHLYFTGYGTQAQWQKLKDMLDEIKAWVEAGKIQVVTRYEYSQLGEYVDNPIVSISLTKDAVAYQAVSDIAESNFTCMVTYQDGTSEICKADRILDLSEIDMSQAGTYDATLRYRGFKAACPVLVLEEIPSEFIIENGSYSGTEFKAGTPICNSGDFVPVIGKKYHFEFDTTINVLTTAYSVHDIGYRFNFGSTSVFSPYVNVEVGINSFHTSMTYECARIPSNKNLLIPGGHNFTAGEWEINNLYCWEVTE